MNHLQIFTVAFVSSVARTYDNTKYYRNNFIVDGKMYSAKAADDYAGKAGQVQFLKAGEKLGDNKITNDCFTLLGVTTVANVAAAKAAAAELAAVGI